MKHEGGFTLIEAVIAMFVLAIAVVTLMGGLVTMVEMSREHRGHAVSETAARSFSQAVVATAQAPAELAQSVTSVSATDIYVKSAATLPEPFGNTSTTFLLLDQEILRLDVVNRATGKLTVARGQGGSVATTHVISGSVKPAVVPHLVCPSKTWLQPHDDAYQLDAGVDAQVILVEFLNSAGDFVSTQDNSCTDDYEEFCPSPPLVLLPECSAGYYRATLRITAQDERYNGRGADTQVLIRSGSA